MSKPQPILSHMPWHIKKQILNNLHSRDKLSIRQCSREFKDHVDQSEIRYDSLLFWLSAEEQKIRIQWFDEGNERMICFQKKPDGYSKEDYPKTWSRVVTNESYTSAVKQFMRMLKTPRVVVEDLSIRFGDYHVVNGLIDDKDLILKAFETELLSLSHQIEVEHLRMTTDPDQDDILHVLPYVKPGTLKSITWHPRMSRIDREADTVHEVNVSKLAELEQWKQAEALFLGSNYRRLPENQTTNFKAMSYFSGLLSIDQVETTIMNVLQNEGYDWLKVHYSTRNFSSLHRYLRQFEKLPRNGLTRTTTYRAQLENTDCFVRLCDDFSHVTIWNPKKCEGKHYS